MARLKKDQITASAVSIDNFPINILQHTKEYTYLIY